MFFSNKHRMVTKIEHTLSQGIINYGPWDKSSQMSIFITVHELRMAFTFLKGVKNKQRNISNIWSARP